MVRLARPRSPPSPTPRGSCNRKSIPDSGPPTLIFPCDFFMKMLGRAAIIALIGRIRRAMPRNADVMVLCNELEGRVVTPAEVVASNQPCNQRNQPKRDRAAYMRSYRAARREEGRA